WLAGRSAGGAPACVNAIAALGRADQVARGLATTAVAAALSSDPRRPRSGRYGTGDTAHRSGTPAPFTTSGPAASARVGAVASPSASARAVHRVTASSAGGWGRGRARGPRGGRPDATC